MIFFRFKLKSKDTKNRSSHNAMCRAGSRSDHSIHFLFDRCSNLITAFLISLCASCTIFSVHGHPLKWYHLIMTEKNKCENCIKRLLILFFTASLSLLCACSPSYLGTTDSHSGASSENTDSGAANDLNNGVTLHLNQHRSQPSRIWQLAKPRSKPSLH